MTMGDEGLFGALALPVVLIPILEKLEQRDMAAAQTLRSAFSKVESQYPGFSYDLVKGIMRRSDILGPVDMTECFLRLEGINNSDEFRIMRSEECFRDLNSRSSSLKKILSRIPDEIYDRKKFLETIKDIASAIKNLLDAVNNVFPYVNGPGSRPGLEQRKRDFVKHSKRFSNTLKEFFRENQQRGPTYVNMTIGSYVCTSCSGLLRGLNPPHRVKSISMTSFTPEEMEFLKSRGNEFCRRVWLGLYDSKNHIEMDTKDENKRRDFMMQKYEKKRYYVAPTDTMHEEARIHNTPVPKDEPKQLKSLAGNVPRLVVGSQSQQEKPKPSNAVPISASSAQASAPKNKAMDLLSDLGGDPFGGNAQTQAKPGANFADFGAFEANPQPPAGGVQNAFAPAEKVNLNPLATSTSFDASFPANFTKPPAPSAASAPVSNITTPSGDKYAAFSEMSTESESSKSIWDSGGSGGGAISWGDGVSGSGPIGGNSQGGGVFGGSSGPGVGGGGSNPFGQMQNPFGGPSTTASFNAAANTGNAFGAPPNIAPSAGAFGKPAAAPPGAGGMFSAAPGSVFGAQPGFRHAAAPQQPSPGGALNPAPPATAAFGGQGPPFGVQPPSYSQAAFIPAVPPGGNFANFGGQPGVQSSVGKPTSMPGMVHNGGGWNAAAAAAQNGVQPGQWGQVPPQNPMAANPFMSGLPQQTGIPTRPANPNNPFL